MNVRPSLRLESSAKFILTMSVWMFSLLSEVFLIIIKYSLQEWYNFNNKKVASSDNVLGSRSQQLNLCKMMSESPCTENVVIWFLVYINFFLKWIKLGFCCDITGLIMNFVKAMNREWQAFKYLREKVPRLSDAKIKVPKFVNWRRIPLTN